MSLGFDLGTRLKGNEIALRNPATSAWMKPAAAAGWGARKLIWINLLCGTAAICSCSRRAVVSAAWLGAVLGHHRGVKTGRRQK